MMSFPLILTLYVGFTHAFETDHLLAVGNIVLGRSNIKMSLKDGVAWGLGHTTTILLVGMLLLLFRINIAEHYFRYLEASVGLMLVLLGFYRLSKLLKENKIVLHSHTHQHSIRDAHKHLHIHVGELEKHRHPHKLAYGVGLVHGLAGSGALILMVMAQINEPVMGLMYLFIFGMGSVGGMLLAAGLFNLPFSKKLLHSEIVQVILITVSGMLCVGYGTWVVYQNLIA